MLQVKLRCWCDVTALSAFKCCWFFFFLSVRARENHLKLCEKVGTTAAFYIQVVAYLSTFHLNEEQTRLKNLHPSHRA